MRSAVIIASTILIIVTLVSALLSFQRTSGRSIFAPENLANVSLKLNGRFGPKYAGEMIASQSGLFQRRGLHLEMKSGDVDAEPIALVSNGVGTFGVARSDKFLVARSRGAPIVAFAAGYLESSVVFYALEGSRIHQPQDFIGKRVARQVGQDTAAIYDAMLARLGISRGQVREVPNAIDISSLINGDVDVWPGHVAQESYILQQKGIAYSVIRPSDFGIHVPGTVYFTSEQMVRDHSLLVQKFLDAIISGWKLAYADYSKSTPIISAYIRRPPSPDKILSELKLQRDIVLPFGRRFTEFDDTQWNQLRDILINERLIDDSIDISKAVNYSFLREAYRKPISFGK